MTDLTSVSTAQHACRYAPSVTLLLFAIGTTPGFLGQTCSAGLTTRVLLQGSSSGWSSAVRFLVFWQVRVRAENNVVAHLGRRSLLGRVDEVSRRQLGLLVHLESTSTSSPMVVRVLLWLHSGLQLAQLRDKSCFPPQPA